MKLSEKIGYILEHLLLIELEARNKKVVRSENLGNESICSDLSFSHRKKKFVLFVTHSRTQGMTNRKFYRTFAELAERRILDPKSICVELMLRRDSVRTPGQYSLIFEKLFDSSVSVFTTKQEEKFLEFVKNYPEEKVSVESTKTYFGNAAKSIRAGLVSAVDKILKTKISPNPELTKYWSEEARVKRGETRVSENASGLSAKLGMKMLALIPDSHEVVKEIAKGKYIYEGDASSFKSAWSVPLRLGIASTRISLNKRMIVSFNANVVFAASLCQRLGVVLFKGWERKFLSSEGAISLFENLISISAMEERFENAKHEIEKTRSAKTLERSFLKEFKSNSERCDSLDFAIRAASTSQNDLSTTIVQEMNLDIKQRNPIWFIVAKDDQALSLFDDMEETLRVISEHLFHRIKRNKSEVSFEEFFADRAKTFFSHRNVKHHLALVELKGDSLGKSRKSIIPRVCQLDAKYKMYVQTDRYVKLDDGTRVFIKTISTPEARHHKHKEFAGKIRAIRYDDPSSIKIDAALKFVVIVDGFWLPEQLGMLAAAGWQVCDWNNIDIVLRRT